ncbi:MAG: hypothetical protein V3T95_00770 [Acidobacteriota bacterium]
MRKKKNNAGRQALEMGTLLGFPDGASSPPDYTEDPTSWICFLHGLSGKTMKLQIGEKTFQLSSDTIYFLEDLGTGIPAAGDDPVGTGSRPAEPFVYICGSLEGLAKTLGDLRNASPGKPFLVERTKVLGGFGN